MTTHSGSPCHAADARYVLFSTFFNPCSIGTTLIGLRQREYTAPVRAYCNYVHELPCRPEYEGLLHVNECVVQE
jgi:hypothetical protein